MSKLLFNAIGLVARPGKVQIVESLLSLAAHLCKRGARILIDSESLSGAACPADFTLVEREDLGKLADLVIVLGGDGTMHDVVNALYANNRLDIPVLLFPAGSGNAFNHDFDSLTYKKAADRLRQFRIMDIDLLEVKYNDQSCISFNMIGWGLVNSISQLVNIS